MQKKTHTFFILLENMPKTGINIFEEISKVKCVQEILGWE
jgi:hypothetical protein